MSRSITGFTPALGLALFAVACGGSTTTPPPATAATSGAQVSGGVADAEIRQRAHWSPAH